MPGAGSALAWDRYAYVEYNPIKYIDPSGHFAFSPPGSNVIMKDGGGGSIQKKMDKFFDPLWGPYYETGYESAIPSELSSAVISMVEETQDAYDLSQVDFELLGDLGLSNELRTQDISQSPESMQIEIHLFYSMNHSPFFIFLDLLGNETGVNYFSGNNYEMNFEPLYLSSLMSSYPDIVDLAKDVYMKKQYEIANNFRSIDYDVGENLFEEWYSSPFDDLYGNFIFNVNVSD